MMQQETNTTTQTADAETAIEITDVTKKYGSTPAVQGLSLDIPAGEVFGLLGPNGAGKSTLIDMMMDYIRPTDGYIRIFDMDSNEDTLDVHRRVGILPDRFNVFSNLTSTQHIEYMIDTKRSDESPKELLERVGLESVGSQMATTYSKGMQQRLGLAMALVGSPDLLILDEPFSGLDPNGVRLVRDIIRQESETGTTVFLSSHVLEQVDKLCTHVALLDEGTLVASGTPHELRVKSGLTNQISMMVAGAVSRASMEAIRDIEGIISVSKTADGVAIKHDCSADWPVIKAFDSTIETEIRDVQITTPTIEDVFVSLTN